MAKQTTTLKIGRWRPRAKPLGLGLVAIAAIAVIATAEITGADGVWRLTLSAQLQSEKRCRLEKILSSRDLDIGGERVREGRVRCLDGREYDFSQKKPHLKFDLRECVPVQC